MGSKTKLSLQNHSSLTIPEIPTLTKSEEELNELKKHIPNPLIWRRRFSETLYPPDLPKSLANLVDYQNFYLQGLEDNETSPTLGKCHYEILAGQDGERLFIASEQVDSTSKDFKLLIYDFEGEVVISLKGVLEGPCTPSMVDISVPEGCIGHIMQGDKPWHPMYSILNWRSQEVFRLQHPKHKNCCSLLRTFFEPTDILIYGGQKCTDEIGTINKYLPRDVHLLALLQREREDSILRSKSRPYGSSSGAKMVTLSFNLNEKSKRFEDIQNLQFLESDITNQSIGLIINDKVDLYMKVMLLCSLFVLDYRLVRNRIEQAPRKSVKGRCSRYCGMYLAVLFFCITIFGAVVFVFVYYGTYCAHDDDPNHPHHHHHTN